MLGIALFGLVRLGGTFLRLVFGRGSRRDDGGVHAGALTQKRSAFREHGVDLGKELPGETVRFKQVAKAQQGRRIGHGVPTDEGAHCPAVMDGILQSFVGQRVPRLQEVPAQHQVYSQRWTATLALRVKCLDQSHQTRPGYGLVHLAQKPLAPRHLLLAHATSLPVPSTQRHGLNQRIPSGSDEGAEAGVVRVNYISALGRDRSSGWSLKVLNRLLELAKHSAIFAKELEYMMNSKAEFRLLEDGVYGIHLESGSAEKGLTSHGRLVQDEYEKEHGRSHMMVPITLPSDIDSLSFPAEFTLPHEAQHGADIVTGYREQDPMGIGIYNAEDDRAPSGIWSPAGREQRGYRTGNHVAEEVFGKGNFRPATSAHVWNGIRGYMIPLPEYKNR